jgi:prevent-host-death family protein
MEVHMTSLNSSEARQHFPDLINEAAYAKKRTIVTRRGKKVAAIVPIEDLEIIEAIENKIDLEEARVALKDIQSKGAISWEDLKIELGYDICSKRTIL